MTCVDDVLVQKVVLALALALPPKFALLLCASALEGHKVDFPIWGETDINHISEWHTHTLIHGATDSAGDARAAIPLPIP